MSTEVIKIPTFYVAGGIGAGAKGFKKANPRLGNLHAEFECLGGVDNDPGACRNFERIIGVKQTCIDLFTREQYKKFHGHEAPADYREAIPEDIFNAAQRRFPWVIFGSLPCKGFSGLLSETKSRTDKYQALNELTLRALFLTLEAFKDDPALFFLFENVPRIQTRGRYLLDQITGLLQAYGYATAETTHDCGELGGLAQSRNRFLLVARHIVKVPNFLYEPPKKKLRCVGDILEKLPLPGDPAGGPMHRIPSLQFKTWVRLAFVEAGKDWRSLNRLNVADGYLKDYALLPAAEYHRGALGVTEWRQTAGTVTSNGRPAAGKFSVADPRFEGEWESNQFGVLRPEDTAPAITSQRAPGQGRFSIADPRIDGHRKSVQNGVLRMSDTAGVVTSKMHVGGGGHSVADPRITGREPYNHVYRIVKWGSQAPSVTSANAGTAAAVADPRPAYRGDYKQNKYRVTGMDEQSGAVIAASTTGNGAFAVADPRAQTFKGGFGVLQMGDKSGTIGGESLPSNGAHAVADPRYPNGFGEHYGKMRVEKFGAPSHTVHGSDRVGSGALSVADPRCGIDPDRPHFRTNAQYGVLRFDQTSGAVSGAAQHDSGPWNVADPRLPEPSDRLIALIISEDNTWHRPFTTLELAALQSLVDPDEMFTLEGKSDSQFREWIGNAVPPDAAEAIAGVMGRAVLAALTGETFSLSLEPIWVRPIAIALQVARAEII